ncbi:tyrosine-type recombinase/integrase [Chryseobacterium rhizosphaerae]|uniref:tyrosine-type recombinase/integrase n=1 Tax=Chryseobacterium rhizosphaerae TaxID=395937 RepID=UPI003D1422C9
MKKHYSTIKVTPKTWDKDLKSNLNKTWEIYYKFFTPEYPDGFPIRFKGMNRCSTLEEKQETTRSLIKTEIENLERGFNPITQEYELDTSIVLNDLTENTLFIDALNIGLSKIIVSENTRKSMEDPVKLISKAAIDTGKASLKISEVRKRDIRIMLDYILSKGYSNDRYNRVKTNIGIIYNYFVDMEIFEYNYIHYISKLPHTPDITDIYRDSDKAKVQQLKFTNYKLWRFLKLYYCSQCRITEFRNIKLSDVFYNQQYFVIFEKKGKRYHKVSKPINISVSELWLEVLSEAQQGDVYLFTNNLSPGMVSCTKNSLVNKYRFWVKKKIGITKDMRSLRHTFANDITTIYGLDVAQGALGHTTPKTTKIYAVDYNEQLLEKQKHLKTSF